MEKAFACKELLVWQKAMDYADSVISMIDNLKTDRRHHRLIEQFESCSASISQNIVEGKGRNSDKEFIQYLYISRGSLFESVTLLYLFNRRSWIRMEELSRLQDQAFEIVRMIKGLINSLYAK